MKQLPHIAAALYGFPWSILPQSHAELGLLYRSYIRGELSPQDLAQSGSACHGISYEADHSQGITIVYLEGIISKRAPDIPCGPKMIDLAKLDSLLDEIAADDVIQTVIFDINSPGGMVVGLQETAERMREISQQKRTIGYADYQCCSAGIYLGYACDEFYAAPSAIIGSIGTYCAGLDDSRAWELDGLELILAKSGSLKAMGHPGKQWTEEERQWLQDKADAVGAEFRTWVTSRRPGVSEATMQGQWFFAKDNAELSDALYRDLPALLEHLKAA